MYFISGGVIKNGTIKKKDLFDLLRFGEEILKELTLSRFTVCVEHTVV